MVKEELICEDLLQYLPSISDIKAFRSTCITNCVFNSFLTFTAIALNIVAIYAIRKTSSLPKTLRTLLLSLAVSDVGVGLFAQPFYTSLLVNWLKQDNPSCYNLVAFEVIGFLFIQTSFLGVVGLSVDRFLAVHLHLRYQELVTHKRVVTLVISLWVFSAFLSFITLLGLRDTQKLVHSVCGVIGIILTAVVYIRIYFIARRHKNQIQVLQAQQVQHIGEMANFATLIKSAVDVFYVFLVFLICNSPYVISMIVIGLNGSNISLKRLVLSSFTLGFLNSSLNPVFYCWKMRHIRHAIMDILRNNSWNKNQSSN